MSYWKSINDLSTTADTTAQDQTVTQTFTGHSSASMTVSGTWTGTLVVEGTGDGTTWTQLWITKISSDAIYSGIPQTQYTIPGVGTTGNGLYRIFNTAGLTQLRCRASAWTSGTATVTVTAVAAVPDFVFTHGSQIQSVVTDSLNSRYSPEFNLRSSNNWTYDSTYGTSTLGVAGIQVSLYADQNCTVKVEQSPDNTNWDLIDPFYYQKNSNFGQTIQAISSYAKVVVTSAGLDTTTFRLQTALCPIVEAVPRSLDPNGNFKVSTPIDRYGWQSENTATGEVRVVTPVKLAGAQFDSSGNAGAVDPNFWTTSINGTGGAITQSASSVTLTAGTDATGYAKMYSIRRGRYIPDISNRFIGNVRLGDTGTANNVREWGVAYGASMPTITDGAFYRLSGTTFSIVTVRASVETVVSSGQFNGQLGAIYTPTLNSTAYEIYWTSISVYFTIGGSLLHTVTSTTNTWASTLMMYAWLSNRNSAAQGTPLNMFVRNAAIHRLGPLESAPNWKNMHGATSSVLKYGPGRLHRVTVNALVNGTTVSVYDSTGAANPIALIVPAVNTNGMTLDYEMDFYNGLYVALVNASTDVTIVYE